MEAQTPTPQLTEQVFMRVNAASKWESITYRWIAAINALGHAYDLKRVKTDGTEEERAKTPPTPEPQATALATRANPNVEFELWWEASGNIDGDTKKQESAAFLGGWFARQSQIARR